MCIRDSINAELYRGGKPAGLSGATVLGRFLRADGATVEVQGQVTGNVASVTFDATCYAVPGRLDVSLQLTQSGVITTPLILHAMIRRGATNVIVDPVSYTHLTRHGNGKGREPNF